MNLSELVDVYLAEILAFVALFNLLVIVLLAASLRKWSRLSSKFSTLLKGRDNLDLEGMLLRLGRSLEIAEKEIIRLSQELAALREASKRNISKVAVVRYNAFPDTGSDLSYAAAFLDAEGNGVVLSSLYGRDESRAYAKPVKNSKSTYVLTDEEKMAIRQAMEN
ncbi:MAG: DUF4446 family protein [Bacillota bacterium]